MTEAHNILTGIVCNGDSIIEACENADLDALAADNQHALINVIEQILTLSQQFSHMIGLDNEELVEQIIEEDRMTFEETPQ